MKLTNELRLQLGAMVLAHVRTKYRTQAAAARAWGVKAPFVAKVISGYRSPTDEMMADAGIQLIAFYKTPNVVLSGARAEGGNAR